MIVFLNGKEIATEHLLLKEFVAEHANADNYAVAVNENFVPRSDYGTVQLSDNDNIELLAPMVGG